MSPQSKRDYLQTIIERYRESDREEKSRILNEFCKICGYHRKYAIERLNTYSPKRPSKRPGKPSYYDQDQIIAALKQIWLAANLPASKRLKTIIPHWIKFLELKPWVKAALLKISPATIDRILKPIRPKFTHRGLSTTRPGSMLRHQIPVKVDQWNEFKPGFLEGDTVAHCGTYLDGSFVVTLDCVDIATGWSEQRANWGFSSKGIVEQVKDIERCLPFKLLGFDCDCGHEFINHDLFNYFIKRIKPVQFTRSRPYKKNDNSHIEQKNWTHVRQWIGYNRLDNKKAVDLLNELYTSQWRLFFNFFIPSVKLIAKTRIGSKTIKTHDKPKTPYQRVLESTHIDDLTKKQLTQIYENLNPFELRKAIETKLQNVFNYSRRLEIPPSLR